MLHEGVGGRASAYCDRGTRSAPHGSMQVPPGLPGCRAAFLIDIPDNSHYRECRRFAELAISSCPALPCPAMRFAEHCHPLAATAMHRYAPLCTAMSDYAATMHRYSDSASTSGATNAMRMGRSPSPPETCTLSPYIRGRALLSSHCRVLSRS